MADAAGQDGVVELSGLDGDNGFTIRGLEEGMYLGYRVASCGDINADGVADLSVSAVGAHPDWHYQAGEVYVVFGRDNLGAGGLLDLAALEGGSGFVLQGVARLDLLGRSLSGAGDINADGVADLLVGAPDADPGGSRGAGMVWVVYGRPYVGGAGVVRASAIGGAYGLTVVLLRFVAVYSVFDTMNIVFASAIKGAGDTRFVMISLAVISAFGLIIPTYLVIIVFRYGLMVSWGIASVYVILLGFVFFFRFRGGKWKAMRVIETPSSEGPQE